ncbi:MAG: hypothetical protein MSC43_02235 [Clostridiales bacterium]|nr:hypothetical protein [Clostridiales bacterium]MDD7432119.1 hypothetical protein [Clostridiales bacterium]MDY3061104.1 hypothetical protein [Eubacteriales bacterium]
MAERHEALVFAAAERMKFVNLVGLSGPCLKICQHDNRREKQSQGIFAKQADGL